MLPRRALVTLATTVGGILLLWGLGFGFGHELRLARWLGRPFLGSATYFGTWAVFVLMLPIGLGAPYLIVRFLLKEAPADYGYCVGDAPTGVRWLLFLTPAYLIVPLASASIGTERYYTYLLEPGFLTPLHVSLHSASYGMFAFGFDGLFRGFLLFGLARAWGESPGGRWAAVGLSSALSALVLIGLPWVFPVSALLAGVPIGFLNLKLRSFLYLAIVHWNLGIWSDIWEILKLNVSHRIGW
jgi:hypothetical protein